jgi:recombination protein RecA
MKESKKAEVDKLKVLDELAGDLPIFQEQDYVTSTRMIKTGSLALDMAIGGGYPSGIVDTYGAESAGKSLLSIMAIAQVQKAGGVAVVWDAERSYSKNLNWMRINGVDTAKVRFLKLRPKEGCEIGFDAIEKIVENKAADLIVVDSIPALVPQDAIDKGMTEHEIMGRRAFLVTRFCSRSFAMLDESQTTVLLINQIRANIASGPAAAFAPKTKETSNLSLRHAAGLRLRVEKISKPNIVDGLPASHRVRVTAVKNKVSVPYRVAEFDISYQNGVDTTAEVADILIGAKEVVKNGAWFTWEGQRYQGRAELVNAMRDPKVFEKALKKATSVKTNTFGVTDQSESDSLSVKEEGDGE